jgi:ABC-type uncharacterized transport system substrate-binding protein
MRLPTLPGVSRQAKKAEQLAEFFQMDKSELLQRMLMRSLLVSMLLALSGCALVLPEAPPSAPATPPEPKPVAEPPPPVEAPPVVGRAPLIESPAEPQPVSARVAIVMTNPQPAYKNVAAELAAWLDDYSIYDLSDRSRSPRQVFAVIERSEVQYVVAVGLQAAKVARSFATVPVIFSQVFNVSENDLVSDKIRGVAMLPPLDLQVEAWRKMDPNIRNVGAILGEGHEDLIAEAEQAMSERGIEFHHAVARSDRETLYHFKRLIRDIDGYLLFPDNRILSREVFTEIMSDAARHRIQVAVFNESLLKHGATFSASATDSNIAGRITIALNEIEKGNIEDVAPLTPLSEIRIQTNPKMVEIFGLQVTGVEIGNSVAEAQ